VKGERKAWVKLPTWWIEDRRLRDLRWVRGQGAANTAALILLIVLAHAADEDTGVAQRTYDQFERATDLSRLMISRGLSVLSDLGLVTRGPEGRSTYGLVGYGPTGWAKLPARALYDGGRLVAFSNFHLRRPAELNAMKLYLLLAARRGRDTNAANISFDKIEEYSGIERGRIRTALSLLTVYGLVHVDRWRTPESGKGFAQGYRLAHVEPYNHLGTTGRALG
jgi:DNA-binding transcriptional ArsR family regulator